MLSNAVATDVESQRTGKLATEKENIYRRKHRSVKQTKSSMQRIYYNTVYTRGQYGHHIRMVDECHEIYKVGTSTKVERDTFIRDTHNFLCTMYLINGIPARGDFLTKSPKIPDWQPRPLCWAINSYLARVK